VQVVQPGTTQMGYKTSAMPPPPLRPPPPPLPQQGRTSGMTNHTAAAGAATFSAAMAAHQEKGVNGDNDSSSSDDETVLQPSGSDLEGAAGSGQMAIPQAVQAVDQNQVRRRFKSAVPLHGHDLRRYVRAGDILNYLGGNRWGHVVMALDPPQALETPTLVSAERFPVGAVPLDTYTAKLYRASRDEKWGFEIEGEENNATLAVVGVPYLGEAIQRWNADHRSQCIHLGDHVVEVNGVRGTASDLLAVCEGVNELNLALWRPQDTAVVAYNVPIFAVKVLQSASNMRDIAESTVCIAVHPLRQCVCAVGPARDGFRVNMGHSGPVEVQVMMSPLCNSSMDFGLFRLAVNEVVRAPHDQKWSMRTAVRSYLRNAALRSDRYQKPKAKVRLGQRLSERWAARPICSTVPARIWQKYLLKRAYKNRGAKVDAADGGCNFSAEAAFADDVLRYMPVKDDRVLPDDLVAMLTDSQGWETLNLEAGPPERRIGDRPTAGQGDPGLSGDKQEIRLHGASGAIRRASLEPGAKNKDGVPVRLGIDHFTVYCGQQVSRPRTATARLFDAEGEPPKPAAKISWDGRCGPLQGPQCSSCRWLEDRLMATEPQVQHL